MRGFLNAHLRRWEQAAEDFGRGRALGEGRPWVQYLHALVASRLGDQETCAALANDLLDRAERDRDVATGAWAAWVCVLCGTLPADPERVLHWAERARAAYRQPGTVLQGFAHTLAAAALCRAGRFEAALGLLENPPAGEGTAWDWLLLGWAHTREGNAAAGRWWLLKAYTWMSVASITTQDTPSAPALPWHQRQELRLLRRLVDPPPQPDGPSAGRAGGE